MATSVIDQQKMEQFVHKVLGDTSALTTTVLGGLGDKLGLFKDLHAQGSDGSRPSRPDPEPDRLARPHARVEEEVGRRYVLVVHAVSVDPGPAQHASISRLVEGDHPKVRFHPEVHLREGSIPGLGGEDMMSHGLDVTKASFQGAGCSDRSRSRKATSELYRLYRAAHRVGICQQQVGFLLRRVGLTIKAPLPRFRHGMEKK